MTAPVSAATRSAFRSRPTVIDPGGFSDDPRAEQMFVTPRDIDTVVRDAAKLIGYGINLALHDGLTIGDVDMFLS